MNNPVVATNVEIEYRMDGLLHIIHVNKMKRDAVDAYIDAINSEIMEREDSLLLSVHNYTHLGGMISPYFMGRLKEFNAPEKQRDDMYGRVALVNPAKAFQILFNPLLKLFSRNNTKLPIRFFDDLEDAVQWVMEYDG